MSQLSYILFAIWLSQYCFSIVSFIMHKFSHKPEVEAPQDAHELVSALGQALFLIVNYWSGKLWFYGSYHPKDQDIVDQCKEKQQYDPILIQPVLQHLYMMTSGFCIRHGASRWDSRCLFVTLPKINSGYGVGQSLHHWFTVSRCIGGKSHTRPK